MKKNDSVIISRAISEFIYDYAPNFLTHSEHTIKSYKATLNLYITYLEDSGVTPTSLSRIHFEREHIENWIKWLISERSCSPETCNVRLGSLRVFLEYLGNKDITYLYLFNESKLVKRQKCAKKKISGLSRNAVSAIIAETNMNTHTGRRDFTFLMLLYGTATRIGELLSLKMKNIYLEATKPYILIYGKRGKIRTAYLLPRVVSNLKEYIKEFLGCNPNRDDYLFYSRVGGDKKKLTEPAIDKRIKKYAASAHEKCSEVPVKTHAHQFRHAKATHWLEDGINIVQISFLLGHENLETTMKYLDITTEQKARALATIEGEIEQKATKRWKAKTPSH